MKLGIYPSRRYSRSWVTQRLVNRAPEYTLARRSPASVMQQLFNPCAKEMEEALKRLSDARYNMFISTANPAMIDVLYRADLPPGMSFTKIENSDGTISYETPRVFATIAGTEYEISIAEKNTIETLWDLAIPSRAEDGEQSFSYAEIIPRTAVADLDSVTPNSVPIKGHLYFTMRNNTNWEVRHGTKIYYPKVYISGLTRKGVELQEVIGLRYNGTFKTINQWQRIDDVFVSYLSDDAYVTLETFPFDAESILDIRNLAIPVVGGERMRFLRLGEHAWGSTLVSDTFTVSDMNIVRLGVDEKDKEYEIELLDENGINTTMTGMVAKPNTNYVFTVDANNFYVYDSSLPYPETTDMHLESPDAKIDLYSDRWMFAKNEIATVKTSNMDVSNVPIKGRWLLEDPDGIQWYVGQDGSLWPDSVSSAWIENLLWEQNRWHDYEIDIELTKRGTYKLTFEAVYLNRKTDETYNLTTKLLWFVPSIMPEAQYELPAALKDPENIFIDSDGKVWLLKQDNVYRLDLFYDYFLTDFENNRLYVRENYTNIRVVP